MIYLESISKLTEPTQDQIERFKQHVLEVHSWYKHIPLLQGSTFTVYLEPDLDREYPTNHPKLPFGNTSDGYQEAFGHLAYQYCIDNYCYQDFSNKMIDGERVQIEITAIPEDYKSRWSCTLYPYCHVEFEEAISLLEDDIEELKNIGDHPQKELLIKWKKLRTQREEYWYNILNDEEKDFLISIDDQREEIENEEFPPRIFEYIKLQRAVWKIEDKLRDVEERKLSIALETLVEDFVEIKSQFSNNK